jgi:hypothetical protein
VSSPLAELQDGNQGKELDELDGASSIEARLRCLENMLRCAKNRLDRLEARSRCAESRLDRLEAAVSCIWALVSFTLPPLFEILEHILTRRAAAHVFCARLEGRWLSIEQVKAWEKELVCMVQNETGGGVGGVGPKIVEVCRGGEAAGSEVVLGLGLVPSKGGQRWEQEQLRQLLPVVFALPTDGYPEGRLTVDMLKSTVRTQYRQVLKIRV